MERSIFLFGGFEVAKTMNDFKFNLQLFGGGGGKGGGGSSSSSSYTPSAQELQIMEYMKDNAANAQTGSSYNCRLRQDWR